MQTLSRSFRDLEGQAGNYADADRAWQDARRRRANRRTAVVAALVAVVLVGGAVGTFRLFDGRQVAEPVDRGVRKIVPPDSATSLPVDAAVGVGVMVYDACLYDCPTFLVAEDGRQYLLGQQVAPSPGNFTLSPDGTWLGQPDEQGYTVRQLDGTAVVRVPLPPGAEAGTRISPWAWSPDSRTLVVGAHRDGDVAQWTRIVLPDAAVSDAPVPKGYEPVGITDTGQLVLMADDAYANSSNRLQLVLGNPTRKLTLVAPGSAVFANSEHGPWVRTSGDRLFAQVYSAETTWVVTYAISGELLEQTELLQSESSVVVDKDGLVVIDVPWSGGPTATLVRLAGTERVRLAEVPLQALVVLPGGTR